MAKTRSPGYPVIGLKEAIEKISSVYQKDYQNAIPRDVAVKHMGYNGLNGKSLGVLSALAKYGLLGGRGDESHVTDLAVQIIAHAPGTTERAQAILEASTEPNLFVDLDSRFQGGKASDQAIRSYLMTAKFIPAAADTALRAYRETKQLVEEESAGYAGTEGTQNQPVMNTNTNQLSASPAARASITAAMLSGSSGTEIGNIPVSKDCVVRLIASGPYDKRSIEALVKNLQLQLELGVYDDKAGET